MSLCQSDRFLPEALHQKMMRASACLVSSDCSLLMADMEHVQRPTANRALAFQTQEAESCCVLQTSKTFWLRQQDGSGSSIPILLLEGRPQQFDGNSPKQDIYERYTHAVENLQGTSAHAETGLPAIGLQIIGADIQ